MFRGNDMARRALLGLLCCAAAAGPALGQESGSLDSLVAGYLAAGQTAPAVRTERQAVPDLGLLLERQLIADLALGTGYSTVGGYWTGLRQRGLADLWRQGNVGYMAKPAAQRTGEGLIPDIQMPLPVLGKVLGSGAEIKLNGLYKFTLGGQQTVYPNNKAAYALGQQGSNFDLKIKQDYRVDLEGVVGDRVHVLIDYDSQIETEKKSKVRLRYEGKEDEILQSLEAGDTEFSITGSSLVGGLTTVHKGLFGIKAVTKLAGLELTAIASKDEGQSQSNTFTAGTSSQALTIDDTRYIRRRFFRLPIDPAHDSLTDVQVYLHHTVTGAISTYRAVTVDQSWQDWAGIPDSMAIDFSKPQFELMRTPEFFVFNDPFLPTVLFLRQSVNADEALGVVLHVYNRATGTVRRIPDSVAIGYDSLSVMLIKPLNCNPPGPAGENGYAWHYELRNFYDLGSRQITNLSLKLQKKTGGNDYLEYDSTSRRSYLNLAGLDPDTNGTVDANYLRLGDDGYFFLPDTQPFNAAALPDPNPDLYRTPNPEQVQSKYRFVASYFSSDVSYRFLASTGRIIEGSVRASLNGVAIPASDYRVDYDIGEIEFINEDTKQRIKQQGAQLKIDYQYLPTFALGSKTLAGVRGVYKFSDKAVLGGTWLYRSEQTPEERPRLGEEPRRIIVAGLDGSVEANPEFLTRAADALPLVETEAASTVRVAGEFAANFPNPNTKGEVYVDDMDGTKQSDALAIDRRYWSHCGKPPSKEDSLYAAQCYWYNPTDRPTQGQINPDMTDENAKDDPVSTLRLHVSPQGADASSWAGITTVISKSGMDFTERKLLNVWVKGNAGRLHIDLGQQINEDQVWRTASGLHGSNGRYDSEKPAPDGSRIYTDATDTGLDSIAGTDGQGIPGDDGNDDFDGNVLAKINGTERNGQFDSEDLLGNKDVGPGNSLTVVNNYFTFTLPLSASGANSYGWRKYSIPLAGAATVGAPYNWNNITYARIWVDSLTAPTDVELALVDVSGNSWLEQRITKHDTTAPDSVRPSERFTVGTKNNRDDADYSVNPPYDPGKDENGNLKFEGCLTFNIEELRHGHAAVARRGLRDRETNYTGYRRLRLYVRGAVGASPRDSFFVRLVAGHDSTQYYQYQAPLSAAWQDVQVELDALSALKKPPYGGYRRAGCYSVRGNPNLTNLSRLQLGVISGHDTLQYPSGWEDGEVWFDDLRLDDVRRDRGTAYWSTVDLRMADLLSLTGTYRHTGAHWYTMGSGTGSGVKSLNYGLNGGLTLSKFLLDRIGFSLPLTFGQSVDEGFPEFGSDDIRLTEDESRAQRSWSRSRNAGFSLSRTRPSGWWLTDATVDRLNYTVGWQQSSGFSRTAADSHSNLNQSLTYGWSPARNPGISVFKLTRFYYLPSSLSSSWNSAQARHWSLEKATGVQSTSGSGATRSLTGSLGWKLTDQLNVAFSQNRDLMQDKWAGDLARRLMLGSETGRSQRVEYATTISWLKVVRPSLNYSTTYNEQHAVVLRDTANGRRDSTMLQNVTNANALTLTNDFPLGRWLGALTPARNKTRDDSLEAGSQQWLLAKALGGLDAFFTSWQGVQVSFTQSKNGSAANLLRRPSLWYQLGWQRRPEGVERFNGLSGTDNNSLGNSYSASTQARLGPVNLTGSWGRNDNWTVTGTVTNYGRTVNWPNLRADIVAVEKIWPRALASSRLATSFNRTTERNYQQDRGLSRLAVRRNFSPLAEWSATWRPRFSTTVNYEWTVQDVQEPGDARQYVISGWRRDYTETRKLSGSFSYSLTAQKGLALNFWKLGRRRFRFANELRLSLTGSYGVRTQKICDARALLAEADYMANTDEVALATQAEYRFSNSITGSLTADYGSTSNKVSSVSDSKRYGLNLLVNVVF